MADGSGRPVMDEELSTNYPLTWRAMENLIGTGKVHSIGLSNFNVLKTKRILSSCRIRPAVNQVELHPFLPQDQLVNFCKQEGILVVAHQPLGGELVNSGREGHNSSNSPLQHPEIIQVAEQCGLTTAQVCLSWAVQRGIPVVPKTVKRVRMIENMHLARLPDHCIATVNGIHRSTGEVRFLKIQPKIGWDPFDEEEDQPAFKD